MKTAGSILKETRKEKEISLDHVAEETKIRKEYLLALEKDDYPRLPAITTVKGFLRNYAQYLNLDPEKIVAVFKRDCQRSQEQGPVFPSSKDLTKQLKWSPKRTLIAVTIIFILAFLAYFTYQYHGLLGRPNLEVYSPIDNQQLTEEQIIVKGKTETDSVVKVNGSLVSLDDQGKFSYRLLLASGENEIVVEATNRLGRKKQQTRTVYLNKRD